MRISTLVVVGFGIFTITAAIVYLWPGLVDSVNAEIKQMLGRK